MDIDQLRTFDRVARDLSFTKAAARLNVTQATVSVRIRVLEDQLGVLLFTRGRRIALTDHGLTFLPYARRILALMQEGREALRRLERGRVEVASLRSVVTPLFSASLQRFQARHQGVDVVIQEGRHEQVVAMLHERAAAFGVICWPNLDPLGADLIPLIVAREPVPLVMAPSLAARLPPDPTIEDVLAVAPRIIALRWWQVEPEGATVLMRRAAASVELPTGPALSLALQGAGVGYFVRSAVAEELQAGRLVEVRPRNAAPLHRDIALIATSESELERPNVRDFLNEVGAEFGRIGTVLESRLDAYAE